MWVLSSEMQPPAQWLAFASARIALGRRNQRRLVVHRTVAGTSSSSCTSHEGNEEGHEGRECREGKEGHEGKGEAWLEGDGSNEEMRR